MLFYPEPLLAMVLQDDLPYDGSPYHIENQSIDLQSKSMDWFLYDRDLRHERVNAFPLIV